MSDRLRVVTRMAATEVVRAFSYVLERVAAGEEVEVTHRGAPVAVIAPPNTRLMSARRFRSLLASAPRPDEDFAEDVRAARAATGPPDNPSPS